MASTSDDYLRNLIGGLALSNAALLGERDALIARIKELEAALGKPQETGDGGSDHAAANVS